MLHFLWFSSISTCSFLIFPLSPHIHSLETCMYNVQCAMWSVMVFITKFTLKIVVKIAYHHNICLKESNSRDNWSQKKLFIYIYNFCYYIVAVKVERSTSTNCQYVIALHKWNEIKCKSNRGSTSAKMRSNSYGSITFS